MGFILCVVIVVVTGFFLGRSSVEQVKQLGILALLAILLTSLLVNSFVVGLIVTVILFFAGFGGTYLGRTYGNRI